MEECCNRVVILYEASRSVYAHVAAVAAVAARQCRFACDARWLVCASTDIHTYILQWKIKL